MHRSFECSFFIGQLGDVVKADIVVLGKDYGFEQRYLTDTIFVFAVNLLGGLYQLGDLPLCEVVILTQVTQTFIIIQSPRLPCIVCFLSVKL